MKIFLEMNFQTDGDFCFYGINDLLKEQPSMYENVIKNLLLMMGLITKI